MSRNCSDRTLRLKFSFTLSMMMRKRSLEMGFGHTFSALTKLASPLACVGVFDFTFWFLFFINIPDHMYFFVFICLVLLLSLAVARWIDIPSSRSLTAKLCRQLLSNPPCISPCILRLHVCCLQMPFHQMMRFVYISLSMSVPEVPYARSSVQPSYFPFPLLSIPTPRRCITAATRLAVACPPGALHR
jgi:hypothetical protein